MVLTSLLMSHKCSSTVPLTLARASLKLAVLLLNASPTLFPPCWKVVLHWLAALLKSQAAFLAQLATLRAAYEQECA